MPTPPSASACDDEELYNRFIEGDDKACVVLYQRHSQRLFAYCTRMLGDSLHAEDLAQEVWERLIDMRNAPRPLQNPIGFLMRMARNLCLDYMKGKHRLLSFEHLQESAHPTYQLPERSEREEMILLAIEKLPYDYREVLILNTYCGYSFEEIAQMLKKSPEAIWTRASRARSQLRKLVRNADGSKPSLSRRDPKIGGKKQ